MPDKTKIINVMGMLPASAPGTLRLALKGMTNFEAFKDELEEQIRFLEDFGGAGTGRGAHVVERQDDADRHAPQGSEDDEAVTEGDIPAFLMEGMNQDAKDQFVLAINVRRNQNRGRLQ